MIPIYDAQRDAQKIADLRGKLSLRPLILQGLDEEDNTSKFDVVRRILRDVREQGDAAVIDYTEKFEKVRLTPELMRVPASEIAAALQAADPKFLAALDVAIENLRTYQTAMLPPEPAPIRPPGGGGQRIARRQIYPPRTCRLIRPRRCRGLSQQRPPHRHPRPSCRGERTLLVLAHA